ncbi:MAG: hypothetical protein ACI93T_002462 [Porticoccaceae bacterium]|jgi:hypothetical protein
MQLSVAKRQHPKPVISNECVPLALPVLSRNGSDKYLRTGKASGTHFQRTVSTADSQRVAYSWKGGMSATDVPSIIF